MNAVPLFQDLSDSHATNLPAPPTALIQDDAVHIALADGAISTVTLNREDQGMRLGLAPDLGYRADSVLLSAIEALTAAGRSTPRLFLDGLDADLSRRLLAAGIAVQDGGRLAVVAGSFWQRPNGWLVREWEPFPEHFKVSEGRRHPLRPSKPRGTVYRRYIPWLAQTISFRAVDPKADLDLFNRWMNDPRVDTIWEERGGRGEHAAALARRTADPHLLPLIGSFGDTDFGYFEVYWAKEDRIGPHYDADDYDRGWHVAIGEEAFRGKACITAWLPSLMHFIFLDDVRTRRIVGEPRASHAQQIRNLDRAGFAKVKHFDFPHKRALLVMLLRERFFSDSLWAPETPGEAS